MNASKLCLYVDAQFTSPYAMSCFVALREKGIEFQMKTLDLDTLEHQTQDYSRISVTQRVLWCMANFLWLNHPQSLSTWKTFSLRRRFTRPARSNVPRRGKFKPGCAVICSLSERNAPHLSCSMALNTGLCLPQLWPRRESWWRLRNCCYAIARTIFLASGLPPMSISL